MAQLGFTRAFPLFGLASMAAVVAAFFGCGPELDRISAMSSLRILGVSKSAPYARPGETVELELLWEDAGADKPREVQRFFGFWCTNPPGNLYSACLSTLPSVEPTFALNQDRFSIEIPDDILRASPNDPNAPESGVAYVFYGVCAGRLRWGGLELGGDEPLGGASGGGAGGASADEGSVDLGELGQGGSGSLADLGMASIPTCVDEDGKALGSADYVVGYSAVYAYDEFRNENPITSGFRVAGKDVAVDCIGSDCVGKPFAVPELEGCVDGVACIESCEDDGEVTCPMVAIQPIISEKSAEKDSIADEVYGTEIDESVWVSYFVDRGSLEADVRLVNDATTGWNDEYRTHFFAPKKKGPMRLWAVVRDSRGGMTWVRIPAYVK